MELDCSGIPFRPFMDFGGKRNKGGQGFAVFGKVTKGMDVVKKIQLLHLEKSNISNPKY